VGIKTTRHLDKLREVLLHPNASGPDPAYIVYDVSGKDKWVNQTEISPGKYNGEFTKTYGHYHTEGAPNEIYTLVSGSGIGILQKKYVDQSGTWIPKMVEEVIFIRLVNPGETVSISNKYAHSLINTGKEKLITKDNWSTKHMPEDYKYIKNLRGFAYYLVEKDGKVEFVPNDNYKNLPEPKWLTTKEFEKLQAKNSR